MIKKILLFILLTTLLLFFIQINIPMLSFADRGGVRENGWLSIVDGQLVNHKGKPLQLRGMSSHGLMWFPEYTNYRSLKSLRAHGANAFRIAMYSDQNDGYVYNPKDTRKILYMAIENTLGADMYAIVDWHTLKDNNPNMHLDDAAKFFEDISKRYSNEPGVIYEIFNEMSGDTTWKDAKKYAEVIIPIIRKNSPNSIILVGTPNHSTDLKSPMKDPLPYPNIMYTYHLYTGTCKGGYKDMLMDALENKFPVFVSEWGLNAKKGEQDIDFNKGEDFLSFLDKNNISWINWSLSNKNESYSVIKNNVTKLSNWTEDDLTPSGKFVFKHFSK